MKSILSKSSINSFYFRLFIFLIVQLPVYAETHNPQKFLDSINGSKNEGEKIYGHFCVNCHAVTPLIPLGAPRVGNETDWVIRLKKGINVIFNNTNNGLNAMPPRGGCFECTDKQLMLAIQFMLPKKPKK